MESKLQRVLVRRSSGRIDSSQKRLRAGDISGFRWLWRAADAKTQARDRGVVELRRYQPVGLVRTKGQGHPVPPPHHQGETRWEPERIGNTARVRRRLAITRRVQVVRTDGTVTEGTARGVQRIVWVLGSRVYMALITSSESSPGTNVAFRKRWPCTYYDTRLQRSGLPVDGRERLQGPGRKEICVSFAHGSRKRNSAGSR